MSKAREYTRYDCKDFPGSSLVAYAHVAPAHLVAILGEPRKVVDPIKTTASWTFVDDEGRPFVIYDYRVAPDWSSHRRFPFHVGSTACCDVSADFLGWLAATTGAKCVTFPECVGGVSDGGALDGR